MTNLTKTTMGFLFVFVGWLITIIINYAAPPITEAIADFSTISAIQGPLEIGAIILMIIAMILFPALIIIRGITEESQLDKGSSTASALIILVFGLIISVVGYFIIEAMAAVPEDTIVQGIMWVGFLVNWLLAVIIAPITCFTKMST